MNWWGMRNLNDPGNHIEFLEAELTRMQKNGEKAIVLSHFPPTSYLWSFGQRFWALMDRFQDVVRMSFAGHSHSEEFHLTRSIADANKPIGWTFMAGSVTSIGGKNPGFNVITLDAEHLVPVEIDTYMFNITQANIEQKDNWNHFHSWTADYKMEDLSPSSVLDFVNRLRDDEETAIKYTYNWHKGGTPAEPF